MIQKFNEHSSSVLTKNVFVILRNGKLVARDLYVQKLTGDIYIAHDGRGIGGIFYEFALTYDGMLKKFVKNEAKKKRLETIKDDYIDFLENKKEGTKIYIKDIFNKTDDYLEAVWNGEYFTCGIHMFFDVDDILNNPFWFKKPEGKNIITEWNRKGHRWDSKIKSWVRI